jgi:hypothetical protein
MSGASVAMDEPDTLLALIHQDKKRRASYYAALGEFVWEFSIAERHVHLLLWHYAGLSERTSKALFSGFKIDGLIGLINRLTEEHDGAEREELRDILDQMSVINNARNLILHHPVEVRLAEDKYVATNAGLALTPSRLREEDVSPEILRNMIADLRKIVAHIYGLICNHLPLLKLSRANHPNASWLYKPQQQAKKPDKSQRHSRRQRRQRRSSPA